MFFSEIMIGLDERNPELCRCTEVSTKGKIIKMNNEQIKEKLLMLRPEAEDFSVTMTGKKSSKVNGLYKPVTREIILHNLNFENDDQLMYTAIHEFAHHLQFTRKRTPGVARFHTTDFWNIFHQLLYEAEEAGIYSNIFFTDPEFIELTEKIKNEFITEHGKLIQDFGRILLSAHELCDKHQVHFDDYVSRVLKIKHTDAQSLIKISNLELDPAIGYENMKTIAKMGNEELRAAAQADLLGKFSPTMVELKYKKTPDEDDDPLVVLTKEKMKIEKTIETLKKKLALVNNRIKEVEEGVPASEADEKPTVDKDEPEKSPLHLVKPDEEGNE